MILFCEYVVEEKHRTAFLDWVRRDPSRWEGVEIAENADQPGVFVELRRPLDEAESARIQKERREGRSGWEEMERWVKGGAQGLRIWTFRPVALGADAGR
ncbi:hypothetical protein [Cohnella nanjingensis]|uniref:DUF4286 family protein n=1 Tax=Cohnella nanjingensis TaxID=1387779 RepID=A0A7X0RP75_9BACL|nr:hypothetical protein [Cohnella nanjingensis]MBB6670903.1 hypothetical protein [Cohnella nanjingensis]